MSYDDFCRLTFDEFGAICKAYRDRQEMLFQTSWEQTRSMLAAIAIQPHTKKKITPQALLPFDWDKKKHKAEPVSKEEGMRRLERRIGRTSDVNS